MRYLVGLCAVSYTVFGLAASAVESLSKLGFISAFLGVALASAQFRHAPQYAGTFLAIVAYTALTWVWAIGEPVQALLSYLTAAMGSVLLAICVIEGLFTPSQFIGLLLVPAVANVCAFILDVNLTSDVTGLDPEYAAKRFSGLIGHPSPYVTRLIMPLAAWVLIAITGRARGSHYWLFGLLSVGSALFAMYSSGSKKALLIAAPLLLHAVAMVGGQAASSSRRFATGVRIALPVIAFSIIGVVLTYGLGEEDLEIERRLESALGGEDESTLERYDLVRIAPALFIEAPLFGHGLDQFKVASGYGYYSHNNLVELAVNGGLFAVWIYYSALVSSIKRLTEKGGVALKEIAPFALSVLAMDITGVTHTDRGCLPIVMLLIAVSYFRAPVERK